MVNLQCWMISIHPGNLGPYSTSQHLSCQCQHNKILLGMEAIASQVSDWLCDALSTLLTGKYRCGSQYRPAVIGLGLRVILHFVVNQLMDFKLDLFKERHKANHGLSVLQGEQGIRLLNQVFGES